MNIFVRLVDILTSRKVFWSLSVLFTSYVLIGLVFLKKFDGLDYWEHLATIYSYSLNLINPDNPYILSESPTHLFTPYHLFWGAVSKVVQIPPYFLLPVMGGLNIAFFVYATNQFSKNIIGDKKYTILLMITMLFFWFQAWGWSGFYHFGLLPMTSVYPYWFALPLSLLVIARYGEKNNNLPILFIPIFPIAFLIHPLTGSFLMITTVVKALTLKNKTWKQKIPLLVIPPFSLLLSFLWPYYPVLDTILNSNKFSSIGFAGTYDMFYSNFIIKISPALLGVPIVFTLLKKKEYFISLSLFIFVSIYALNYFFIHSSTLARYIIFIGFFLQVLIVIGIKELESKSVFKYFSTLYMGILLISIPLHLYSSILQSGIARSVLYKEPLMQNLNIDTYDRFRIMQDYIEPKSVVMANMNNSWKLPGILACKVVPVNKTPFSIEDFSLRKKQTEIFFDKSTLDQTKEAILKEYKVKYILFSKKVDGDLIDFIKQGKVVYEDNEYVLLKVFKK